MTENGCLRVMSSPGYPFPGFTVERVRGILKELTGVEGHHFWPDPISILDSKRFELTGAGPKHVTDLYLLGLAASKRGRLVTFDRNISVRAIAGFRPDDVDVLTAE